MFFQKRLENRRGKIRIYATGELTDEINKLKRQNGKDKIVYGGAKGSVKIPLDKPIPYDLIGEIVQFRVKENLAKAETKK